MSNYFKNMVKWFFVIGLTIIVFLSIVYAFFIESDQLAQKIVVVTIGFLFISGSFLISKKTNALALLIVFTFFNLPIYTYGTTSSNLLIISFLIIFFFKEGFRSKDRFFSYCFKNKIFSPLCLIMVVYIVSLLFIKKMDLIHFTIVQTVFCGIVLILMIIEIVDTPNALKRVNKILLVCLVLNLLFSFFCITMPQLETIRSNIMSMTILTGDPATRLAGLSFRGEAYGEYLMMCSLVLTILFITKQGKTKAFLGMILLACLVIMILNKTRGAFVCYWAGFLCILFFTNRKYFVSKLFIVSTMCVFIFLAFYYITFVDTGQTETIIDRFEKLGGETVMIGYIPKDRYYTWAPSLRIAKQAYWIGVGPSFSPHTIYENPANYLNFDGLGKLAVTWPHNLYILIVATIGIQGLIAFLFLFVRIVGTYRYFTVLDKEISAYYQGYIIAFLMFLIEAIKFDGALRHAHGTFYFLAITIGLIATSQTLVAKSKLNSAK